MKRLLIILIIALPLKFFGQLVYTPITESNIKEKHKLYFMDNKEVLWKVKLRDNVKFFFKNIPYNEIMYYGHPTGKITPKEYLITDNYMYFPNDSGLLVLNRKGKLVTNIVEPRVRLFDNTPEGKYTISTPGGKCEGNPKQGYFMEFCGNYLFYITGKKVICMDKDNFEVIQEYNFADFKNRAKAPNYKYIFEAVEFKVTIEGHDLVE